MNDIHYLIKQKENKNLQFEEGITQIDSIVKTAIAFCNTNGGDLIIGINKEQIVVGIDKKDKLLYCDVILNALYNNCFPHIIPEIYSAEVEEKNVLLVRINSSMQKPHYLRSDGRQNGTYVRKESRNILANQFDLESLDRFKRRQYFESGCDFDISWDLNHFTLFSQHIIDKLDIEPEVEFFEKHKLIKKTENGLRITNLGILFSDLKSEYFSSLNVVCNKKGDTDNQDSQIIKDNILSSIDKVNIFLKSSVLLKEDDELFSIIKELFLNALVHRDYSLINENIEFDVYENSIEIISPGNLGVNVESLNFGYSYPINPYLHNFLAEFKQNSIGNYGYKRIGKFLIKNPDFQLFLKEADNCVKVKLIKGHSNDPEIDGYYKYNRINEPNNDPKTILKVTKNISFDPIEKAGDPNVLYGVPKKRYELIIQKMTENPSVSIRSLSEQLGVSEKTVKRDIEKLKRNGIIRRIGEKRNGYWEVVG